MGLINQEPIGVMKFELIEGVGKGVPELVFRSKVPGGWLIHIEHNSFQRMSGTTFLPDPEHKWDGNSL